MSTRSTQAFSLGRYLTTKAGVEVEMVYDTKTRWLVCWGDGPTTDEMQALVDEALTHRYHFGAMADREIRMSRGESTRAWAARAIAAYSDGSLAEAVAADVARRYALGVVADPSAPRFGSRYYPPEWYAVQQIVDELIRATSFPERADDPSHEPLIKKLVDEDRRQGGDMASIIVSNLCSPKPGQGPAVRSV